MEGIADVDRVNCGRTTSSSGWASQCHHCSALQRTGVDGWPSQQRHLLWYPNDAWASWVLIWFVLKEHKYYMMRGNLTQPGGWYPARIHRIMWFCCASCSVLFLSGLFYCISIQQITTHLNIKMPIRVDYSSSKMKKWSHATSDWNWPSDMVISYG